MDLTFTAVIGWKRVGGRNYSSRCCCFFALFWASNKRMACCNLDASNGIIFDKLLFYTIISVKAPPDLLVGEYLELHRISLEMLSCLVFQLQSKEISLIYGPGQKVVNPVFTFKLCGHRANIHIYIYLFNIIRLTLIFAKS